MKPYEMMNNIGGGGVNLQFISADNVKQYLLEKAIIKDVHMIQRVVDRLRSKKEWIKGTGNVIAVKKFDSIIKPYVTRVMKAQEIQVQLGSLKKLIFEKDMTISDFFVLCQNQYLPHTSSKGYFNTSSSPAGVTP